MHAGDLYRLCDSNVVFIDRHFECGVFCIKNDNNGKQFHSRKNRIRSALELELITRCCANVNTNANANGTHVMSACMVMV